MGVFLAASQTLLVVEADTSRVPERCARQRPETKRRRRPEDGTGIPLGARRRQLCTMVDRVVQSAVQSTVVLHSRTLPGDLSMMAASMCLLMRLSAR